ncbi:SidA/IucD/PvdA family monooxygenase [Streptomyces nojiriensis]|uniref:SidA/IucD/PvdA family monooxygenase n=1 Tax=Streptomyces nojiriensis TaxID=66374 RepID=UPI0035D6D3CF
MIGAGPKGMALAAKAAVLFQIYGDDTPRVVLLDNNDTGAHWSGNFGYTDGTHALATPPLKDVGFPYRSRDWGSGNRKVNLDMLAYSWQAFLVDEPGTRARAFDDWVDRGLPAPSLSTWAEYLKWVERRLDTTVDHHKVCKIDIERGQWRVSVEKDGTVHPLEPGQGLVITGPGPARRARKQVDSGNRVTDAQNFWLNRRNIRKRIEKDAGKDKSIGIVGDGGAAASVIMSILERCPKANVKVISPMGVTYTRGESYDENRHYSNTSDWVMLNKKSREKFIQHTSSGVFSTQVKRVINDAENLETACGEVASIVGDSKRVTIDFAEDDINPSTGKKRTAERFDFVIVAMGFDAMWWSAPRILGKDARGVINSCVRGGMDFDSLGDSVGRHLEVSNMLPKLHLPMLAAMQQGPGFPGLGSLGLLSDRILSAYCGETLADRLDDEYP